MSLATLYLWLAGALFVMALGGVFLCRHFLKKIIAVNILGASVFLLLVSVARRDAGEFADPVPHAMVITGLVVAVSASAFALALARRIWTKAGRVNFEEEF
ncbi:MAG: NADH-quinone oxidoreductase subunit K [Opitutales bacterium]|nr:NADH-quinone oxidoreductase subunit K [Opitutales bacterium]